MNYAEKFKITTQQSRCLRVLSLIEHNNLRRNSNCLSRKTIQGPPAAFFEYPYDEMLRDHAMFVQTTDSGAAGGARAQATESRVAELESEVERLRNQVKELADKNKMQLEQINGLLLEKVNLQSEGIDQRDRMLQRERAIG